MHLRKWREGNEGRRRPGRAGCSCCFIIKIGTGGGDAPCAPIYSVEVSGLGCLVDDGGRCTRAKMKVRSSHSIIWIECCAWVPAISFFFVPALTSPRLTARLVTPPRSHRNEYTREEAFSLAAGSYKPYRKTFLSPRGARKRQHRRLHFFTEFLRAAPLLSSLQVIRLLLISLDALLIIISMFFFFFSLLSRSVRYCFLNNLTRNNNFYLKVTHLL